MTASASPDPAAGADPAARPADLKDLRHDVEDTAHIAAERGRGLASAARKQAYAYVDQRKGEAARSVGDIAQSIRDSGRTFEDRPNLRAFFDSAAEGLDGLAGSIERRGLEDFYAEAEAFARRSPVTTAVATFAAGFLLARFIKASGEPAPAFDRDHRA
jgi:hypothetical protein